MKKHFSLITHHSSPITPFHSLLLAFLFFAACSGGNDTSNDGTVEFRSPKGDIVAVRTIQGSDTSWNINNALGEPLIPGTDSLWVIPDTTNGQPKEVLFYHQGNQTFLSFWDNMERMSEGDLKNGRREGCWTGYERNTGKKQSETYFSDGLEHGSYTVYNENGSPSITGQYILGQRSGEWSFFDKEGILLGTKQY